MRSVLLAELAILFHFDSVRIVLLVFHRIVISLLTLLTCQRHFYSHNVPPIYSKLEGSIP